MSNTWAARIGGFDLSRWRELGDIWTHSWWDIPRRDNGHGHQYTLHGSFVPHIPQQLISRYTRPGEIVLDWFVGSGTSVIEALKLDRRIIGQDINWAYYQQIVDQIDAAGLSRGSFQFCLDDSTKEFQFQISYWLRAWGETAAHLAILHPPYYNIVKFTEQNADLSRAESVDVFMAGFSRVAETAWRYLQPGRVAGLVIGDIYAEGEVVPLGFMCMEAMRQVGFRLKGIVVKNMTGNEVGKGQRANLWRYRALAGGFYTFDHEYIMVFRRGMSDGRHAVAEIRGYAGRKAG